MSPLSLLHTPVDLLRTAPADGEHASRGERRERRAALAVVIGCVSVVVLAAALASAAAERKRCTPAADAPGAAVCLTH